MLQDQVIHREHLAGATLRDLAQTHGASPEGIRLAVAREGRRQIDQLELDLMVARRYGEWPTYVIPNHAGPDFDLAVAYVRWVTGELTERGLQIKLHPKVAYNGLVIQLEDVTPPATKEQR